MRHVETRELTQKWKKSVSNGRLKLDKNYFRFLFVYKTLLQSSSIFYKNHFTVLTLEVDVLNAT